MIERSRQRATARELTSRPSPKARGGFVEILSVLKSVRTRANARCKRETAPARCEAPIAAV